MRTCCVAERVASGCRREHLRALQVVKYTGSFWGGGDEVAGAGEGSSVAGLANRDETVPGMAAGGGSGSDSSADGGTPGGAPGGTPGGIPGGTVTVPVDMPAAAAGW